MHAPMGELLRGSHLMVITLYIMLMTGELYIADEWLVSGVGSVVCDEWPDKIC